MKLKGSIDDIRETIFRVKSRKRRRPYALKMRELEDTFSFIDENKWKVKKENSRSKPALTRKLHNVGTEGTN